MPRCDLGRTRQRKSTLARQLAPALKLPLIDKDDILERLFETKGVGDAAWRKVFSRESDEFLAAEAASSQRAVLVSHWRLPGMAEGSGTPTSWLSELPHQIVHVRCVCTPKVAAERFFNRKRHSGHLDREKSYAQVLAGIRELARLGPLELGESI